MPHDSAILLSSLVVIGVLVFLAYLLPPYLIKTSSELPKKKPFVAAVIGLLFYPSLLVLESLLMNLGVPAILVDAALVADQLLFLIFVTRVIGRHADEKSLIALSIGLIASVAALGSLAEFKFPLVLALDFIFAFLFFRWLWKNYDDKAMKGGLTSAVALLPGKYRKAIYIKANV